ncbi:hypothetical protein BV25DRAFT_311737 [Artomyces pyxidatus]|uniref:Uncharacterized protein n=1 Tax=Artomyces pyxidatus TaxID=48021 RepID=A0ACB8T750_9AGAM|nr:hypothetical protein BV25DRAFT_311737 [Artomyces pyxidatus]
MRGDNANASKTKRLHYRTRRQNRHLPGRFSRPVSPAFSSSSESGGVGSAPAGPHVAGRLVCRPGADSRRSRAGPQLVGGLALALVYEPRRSGAGCAGLGGASSPSASDAFPSISALFASNSGGAPFASNSGGAPFASNVGSAPLASNSATPSPSGLAPALAARVGLGGVTPPLPMARPPTTRTASAPATHGPGPAPSSAPASSTSASVQSGARTGSARAGAGSRYVSTAELLFVGSVPVGRDVESVLAMRDREAGDGSEDGANTALGERVLEEEEARVVVVERRNASSLATRGGEGRADGRTCTRCALGVLNDGAGASESDESGGVAGRYTELRPRPARLCTDARKTDVRRGGVLVPLALELALRYDGRWAGGAARKGLARVVSRMVSRRMSLSGAVRGSTWMSASSGRWAASPSATPTRIGDAERAYWVDSRLALRARAGSGSDSWRVSRAGPGAARQARATRAAHSRTAERRRVPVGGSERARMRRAGVASKEFVSREKDSGVGVARMRREAARWGECRKAARSEGVGSVQALSVVSAIGRV